VFQFFFILFVFLSKEQCISQPLNFIISRLLGLGTYCWGKKGKNTRFFWGLEEISRDSLLQGELAQWDLKGPEKSRILRILLAHHMLSLNCKQSFGIFNHSQVGWKPAKMRPGKLLKIYCVVFDLTSMHLAQVYSRCCVIDLSSLDERSGNGLN